MADTVVPWKKYGTPASWQYVASGQVRPITSSIWAVLLGGTPSKSRRVPAGQVEQPRHQLVAHLLGVGGVVHRADLDAALANAPGQLGGVRLAVAAQEAGDRFAGLDA